MSRPFYKITCTGCSYQDQYHYGIHYVYEGLEEHEPVLRAAWCNGCGKIVNITAPFTVTYAECQISDTNNSIEQKKRGFFAQFSSQVKNEVLKLENELQAIRIRLKYFSNMAYRSKCLSCGGSHVYPFNVPYGNFDELVELNIRHTCGGQMLISMAGRYSFTSRPKVVYDESGSIKRDERK